MRGSEFFMLDVITGTVVFDLVSWLLAIGSCGSPDTRSWSRPYTDDWLMV